MMADRFPRKRITVYCKSDEEDGVVISISPQKTLLQLFSHLEELFEERHKVTALYNALGAKICDIDAIRDDEVLYLQKLPSRNGTVERTGDRPANSVTPTSPPVRPLPPSRIMRSRSGDWLTLNVGGKYFMTTRSTLVEKLPESMLARMFSRSDENPWQNKVDETGAFLIDRSPKYFEPVLNFLRHGQLILDKGISAQGVLEEAKFFGIEPLIGQLEVLVKEEQIPIDLMPISRRELVFKLMGTETSKELRCQGVNFSNSNLSKLDLRHVNFKYAILRGADLSSANLSFCNFERADLSQAKLDGANLQGVKMLCVSLEGASMTTANFEDPAGCRANMEGANMKSVNLEGSHMSGVNLRVANLKNANLQNCDLRGAVLAGADLENCNLSGCDLQEANLRGANLEGAAFELMLNPLHMAQTVR